MTLNIITWVWGSKYPGHYIERLERAVARNMKQDYRFILCQPLEYDEHLTRIPGCFARLRTFDPAWQEANGIKPGERIVCLDLDMVITGNLDEVFDRPDDFAILQGVNATNPNPYNGSVWMLRAGYRPDVWSDFSLEAAKSIPWYAFPDDQSWFHHKMPGAGAFGPATGVFAFCKAGWPTGARLPLGAKIVAFPGHRDPAQFQYIDWVRANWK
jgi:hypothetical protein